MLDDMEALNVARNRLEHAACGVGTARSRAWRDDPYGRSGFHLARQARYVICSRTAANLSWRPGRTGLGRRLRAAS